MSSHSEKRIALFPGTFDPFTKGHEDIVLRGATIFDEVIIGLGDNSNKQRFFSVQSMVEKINLYFKDNPKIRATRYEGLTAKFAMQLKARYILRGLRNTTDFEYENSIAQANRDIFEGLETIFLITSPQYAYISSTVIREIYRYGHDISRFVPFTLESE